MPSDKTPFLPEVVFEVAPVELEADLFYSFSSPKRHRWHERLYRVYPELKGIFEKSANKKDVLELLRPFVEETIKKNEEKILLAKNKIHDEWKQISSEFLKTLAEHFETSWPEDSQSLKGTFQFNRYTRVFWTPTPFASAIGSLKK